MREVVYKSVITNLIFCSCFLNASTQSLNTLMAEARDYTVSKEKQIENLEQLIYHPKFQDHQDTLGLLFYYIAYRQLEISDFENTIRNSNQAIKAFESDDFEDYQLARSYYMRAISNHSLGRVSEAQIDLDKVILDLKIEGRGYESLWRSYAKSAEIIRTKGELESAIHYLNSFIESEQFDFVDGQGQASIYRELSYAYSIYNNYNKLMDATRAIQKAEKVCENYNDKFGFLLEQLVLNKMHKAFISWKLENRNEAIAFYKETISLMEDVIGQILYKDLSRICLINIAELYLELNQCEQAFKFISKAEELFTNRGNPNFIEIESELILTKSKYLLCVNEFKVAQNLLQDGKNLLLNNWSNSSIKGMQNYPYKEFLIDNYYNELRIIDANKNKKSRVTLLTAKAKELDSLIGFYLEDMYFNSSMWALKENLDKFYKMALDISYESGDLESFWYYAEQRSNLLLLKNQRYNELGKNEAIDRVEESLDVLKREVASLENNLFFMQDSFKTEKYDSLQSSLIHLRSEQLNLLGQRTTDVDFESSTTVSLHNFREKIDDETTILHYQFGSDSLYVFKIENINSSLSCVAKSSKIKDLINMWFSSMSNSTVENNDTSSVDDLTDSLFRYLVQYNEPLKKNVIIIPDEELHYLSFETLRNESKDYLIRHHCIHYDLSGTLALDHLSNNKMSIESIAAFLPNYKNENLVHLSNSAVDISSIEGSSNLNIFSDAETDRDQFMHSLKNSDLIHFGGHAIHVDENNQYSHLAFVSDEKDETNLISLADLYSMNNICSVVSIPACNTGIGSVLQGEGISSLSRGFFFAGAQTVISSLWNVNDRSTSIIMNSFYDYLQSGHSTGQALRLAKLNYLDTAPDFLKHPFLWGGLTITGSDQYVQFKNSSLSVFAIAVVLLCFLLWLYKMKRK